MRWFGLLVLSLAALLSTATAQTTPRFIYGQLEQRLSAQKTHLLSSDLFGTVSGASFIHEGHRVFVVDNKDSIFIAVQESQVSGNTDLMAVVAIYRNKPPRGWSKNFTLTPHANRGAQAAEVELSPELAIELRDQLLPVAWEALGSK